MYWLRLLQQLIDLKFRTNGHRAPMQPAEEPAVDSSALEGSTFRPNEQLTEHFSLYELTVTTKEELQQANRTLTDEQVEKLHALAEHAETIRGICGHPITVHSGYRSPALNTATTGSSSTSQHPKCEALDLAASGQSVDDTFNALLAAARRGEFKFGQLIIEQATRSYGVVRWVHCSVVGTLDPSKVGQVMKMVAGLDGVPHYVLVDKLNFPM